jgi:hypothetical protein
MKIGIFFTPFQNRSIKNGPIKVVNNLIKGFDLQNIEYNINTEGEKNIILQNCSRLLHNLNNCILGPNICTLPIDNHYVMNYNNYNSFIVPCKWTENLYSRWLPISKIFTWPVGIDTDIYSDKSSIKKDNDCLVYFKRRNIQDLKVVEEFLSNKKQTYAILNYGSYDESLFLDLISRSRYSIVIDNCESQGIAIQEMMSCNLPLLVWDVRKWVDRGEEYICDATSVPYWSDECGVKFYSEFDLEKCFSFFIENLHNFRPRDYIINNLSLGKQSLEIYNKMNLPIIKK